MTKINFVEVGPRDGFQNVKEFIPTELKLDIIDRIVKANVRKIQLTSFVNAKVMPQMKDAKIIVETALLKYNDVDFFALVPNLFGAKIAVESKLKEIAYVTSVSESHNQANIRRPVNQSFEELKAIRYLFPDLIIDFDIATAFGCPFEGVTPIQKVIDFVGKGTELGLKKFNLCDTIGVSSPKHVRDLVLTLKKYYPEAEFSVHIHDTRNMGMACTLAAIESGIDTVQASIGGLGGCPFAPGASGNTASEDLIYMLNSMGYDTGVNFDQLLEVAKLSRRNIDGNFSGHHINISNQVCNM